MTPLNRRQVQIVGTAPAAAQAFPSAESPDVRPGGNPDRLLARYLRRAACSAAAGMGVFGLSAESSSAAIITADAPEFLQKKLVGNPYYSNPYIEWEFDQGAPQYPFRTTGWATEGFTYNYFGYAWPTAAFGIDIDYNGSGDVNFFRGSHYGGYILAGTVKVGFYTSPVPGSGQVNLLSNSTDNPDADGAPSGAPNTPGGKTILQGFNAGEIIGDGNDLNIGVSEGVMRGAGRIGDWDGVDDNFEDIYGYGNPGNPSYVGFQITGLSTGTGSGFGWIEVILREGGQIPQAQAELQIIRWAFTDDGSSIAAGDVGSAGLLGDYNQNDVIDAADYTTWRDAMTAGSSTLPNDITPGVVDESDFLYWRAHFGETLASGRGAATSPVPEPTALGLLAAGGGALALAYRRRKR